MCYPSNKGRYDLERGSEILRAAMVTTCQFAIPWALGTGLLPRALGGHMQPWLLGDHQSSRRSGQTWLPLLWAQKTEHPAKRVTVDPYNVMEFARLSRATQLASSS